MSKKVSEFNRVVNTYNKLSNTITNVTNINNFCSINNNQNYYWNGKIEYINFYTDFNISIIDNYDQETLYIVLPAKPIIENIYYNSDINYNQYTCNKCKFNLWENYQNNNKNLSNKFNYIIFGGAVWMYRENNLNVAFKKLKNKNNNKIINNHLPKIIIKFCCVYRNQNAFLNKIKFIHNIDKGCKCQLHIYFNMNKFSKINGDLNAILLFHTCNWHQYITQICIHNNHDSKCLFNGNFEIPIHYIYFSFIEYFVMKARFSYTNNESLQITYNKIQIQFFQKYNVKIIQKLSIYNSQLATELFAPYQLQKYKIYYKTRNINDNFNIIWRRHSNKSQPINYEILYNELTKALNIQLQNFFPNTSNYFRCFVYEKGPSFMIISKEGLLRSALCYNHGSYVIYSYNTYCYIIILYI